MMRRTVFGLLLSLTLFFCTASSHVQAKETQKLNPIDFTGFYKKTEALTFVPWEVLAAVDQVERHIHKRKSEELGICFEAKKWAGPLNPDLHDTSPLTITFFDGLGEDGNGDGKIDQTNPEDVLFTMGDYLSKYGYTLQNEDQGLMALYGQSKTIDVINEIALIYQHFGTIDLGDHHFIMPLTRNYDMVHNWGAGRGWGGRRRHEGTDIFASYGTPILSTTYGIVEMKGWNKYGGWRIGIRDPRTNYHYYAHLMGFAKGIKTGSFVKPGETIGYVGSSGYGPKGTQGKFPPHLHYGIYAFNGKDDYGFDPYPFLRLWERQQKQKKN